MADRLPPRRRLSVRRRCRRTADTGSHRRHLPLGPAAERRDAPVISDCVQPSTRTTGRTSGTDREAWRAGRPSHSQDADADDEDEKQEWDEPRVVLTSSVLSSAAAPGRDEGCGVIGDVAQSRCRGGALPPSRCDDHRREEDGRPGREDHDRLRPSRPSRSADVATIQPSRTASAPTHSAPHRARGHARP
jgi:hypothetical protein